VVTPLRVVRSPEVYGRIFGASCTASQSLRPSRSSMILQSVTGEGVAFARDNCGHFYQPPVPPSHIVLQCPVPPKLSVQHSAEPSWHESDP
jgi:hypothetical protein